MNTQLIILKMKFYAMVLSGILISSQLSIAKPTESQISKSFISISFEKTSLKTSISELEKKSKVKFSYNTTELRKISVKPQKYATESSDNNFSTLELEDIVIKGKVSDSQGGLPGVSVKVEGTSAGIVTDVNGNFTITAPENATLVFSYVGYNTKRIPVNNQRSINVVLEAESKSLEEVVVVGYGTQKKSDVTGAIVSVNEKAIRETPAANLAQALQGQAAGVDIQRSGGNSKPGATPVILIRGTRSVRAGNEPLIVVDGIPFNGDFNDLNQADVSSVEILKDASSTAIYGSRGANGVILVSTKRGKTGKTNISYSGYAGPVNLQREFPVMNAQEFYEFKKLAWYNGRYTGANRTYASPDDPKLIADAFTPSELATISAGGSTDWQKHMYKTGVITEHQLRIDGGSESSQFALSGGYFNETGIYHGQGFERFSLKANLDQQLGKRLKLGFSTNNTFTQRQGEDANPMAQALRASPLASPFKADGTLLNDFVPGSASQVWNPLANFIDGAVEQNRKRFGTFTTAYLDVNIGSGLKYKFNSGIELRNDTYGEYFASKTTNNLGASSSAQNRNNFRINYTLENILTYDKLFAKKHKVNFTGLFSLQEQNLQNNGFRYQNIASDDLQYYNPTFASNLAPTNNNEYEKWDIISYMGRLNYSYDDRYVFTGTMRIDGSSRLSEGQKYNMFPSAAIAWNVMNESFLKGSSYISNLRLRASYGKVGNTAINPYQTLGALAGLVYNYGSTVTTGVYQSQVRNPKLEWEYTSTANLGLDFGVLKNRISGSIEAYQQITDKLLLPQDLPSTSGIPNAILTNVGKTENKGLEMQITTINFDGKSRNKLGWTTNTNVFINRGKILALAGGKTIDIANNWFVGAPIGVYYDYVKVGIWQNTLEDIKLAQSLGQNVTGINSVIGDIKRADLNGDNKLDDTNDRRIIGTSQPKWEGGMSNTFSYKGFDFTVNAFARWGHMIRSTLHGAGFVNTFQGNYNNIKTPYWTETNGENEYPKPNANRTNPANNSLLGYFDGSYVKIRTITLGYNFSSPLSSRLGAKSIRVYTTAEDPFLLFSPYVNKYGGIDPEAGGFNNSRTELGVDTPSNRSIVFGVRVSL